MYDVDGNLLEEKGRTPMDTEVKRVASEMRKDMEDILQQAGSSMETMHIVSNKFQKSVSEVTQELPENKKSRVEEIEGSVGCNIPSEINIFPPSDVRSRGSVRRIRGHFDKGGTDKKKESKKKEK